MNQFEGIFFAQILHFCNRLLKNICEKSILLLRQSKCQAINVPDCSLTKLVEALGAVNALKRFPSLWESQN